MPLLSLVALFILLANRGAHRKEAAWAKFLSYSLVSSGLLNSLLLLALIFHFNSSPNELTQDGQLFPQEVTRSENGLTDQLRSASFPLDAIDSFPQLPNDNFFPGNAEKAINSTVFLVAANRGGLPWLNSGGEMGTAVLLWSSKDAGYLFGTAAHVVKGARKVRIACNRDTQRALDVNVIGSYPNADLALLWMSPSGNETEFLQPILAYGEAGIGSPVFSIGHPEGHLFTFSQGLLSQKREPNVLQTDAAVSPGNSGGPLYDSQGNLLAIISFVHDKAQDPNAENLNFGYRADIFLESTGGWMFLGRGAEIHRQFLRAHKASRED
jgi:S1-C subfamily serine protease